jgi:hypothetical protein
MVTYLVELIAETSIGLGLAVSSDLGLGQYPSWLSCLLVSLGCRSSVLHSGATPVDLRRQCRGRMAWKAV